MAPSERAASHRPLPPGNAVLSQLRPPAPCLPCVRGGAERMRSGGVVGRVQEEVAWYRKPVPIRCLQPLSQGLSALPAPLTQGSQAPRGIPSAGAKGAGMCLAAGLARQNRQKLTKRGALCYDGGRRCQIRQAVSTSRKGGDAHGYIRRADPDRYFDREHLQSGLSDLQKEMTAPGQGVRSNPLIQT